MEIQIRQATIQDLNVLMQWRMEVLHEVFSIPSERSVTELESENRRYYQTELPQGGHIACFCLRRGGNRRLRRDMPLS